MSGKPSSSFSQNQSGLLLPPPSPPHPLSWHPLLMIRVNQRELKIDPQNQYSPLQITQDIHFWWSLWLKVAMVLMPMITGLGLPSSTYDQTGEFHHHQQDHHFQDHQWFIIITKGHHQSPSSSAISPWRMSGASTKHAAFRQKPSFPSSLMMKSRYIFEDPPSEGKVFDANS